jgi:hypothetical protein
MNGWAIVTIAAVLSTGRVEQARSECVAPRVTTDSWPLTRATGLTLRVPPGFLRDAPSGQVRAASSTSSWSDTARARLVVRRVSRTDTAATVLPSADGRPDYSRCEERAGSGSAVIVSFSSRATQAAQFQLEARIRWPDGEEIEVRGTAEDRRRFEELLAAVRTVRRAGA